MNMFRFAAKPQVNNNQIYVYFAFSIVAFTFLCCNTGQKGVVSQFQNNNYVNQKDEPFISHSIDLGLGWAGNTINTVIFRHHGILTFGKNQYTAFYLNQQELNLVKRNLITNEIFTSVIRGNFDVFDAHNSISIGIDSDGFLHISYDHHGHALHYRQSLEPLDISEWSDHLSMTGYQEDRVTYPAFVMNPIDSTLFFLYRDGGSTNGRVCVKEFVVYNRKWYDFPTCIMTGYNQTYWSSNPYYNHPVFDKKEGKMHLSYVWRSRMIGYDERNIINNKGIDYTYTKDNGITWYTTKGYNLQLPITQVNSETVWAVPLGASLINQTSMAVDTKNNPHIVYYANDENDIPQYQHLWYDGKKWNNTVISNRKTLFILSGKSTLQLPMSRPEIVIDISDVVYVIFRADIVDDKMSAIALFPPNYKFDTSNIRILWDEQLGFSEPVIDRLRWNNENILSMLIQYNNQPHDDKNIEEVFKPVFIFDEDLIKIFTK